MISTYYLLIYFFVSTFAASFFGLMTASLSREKNELIGKINKVLIERDEWRLECRRLKDDMNWASSKIGEISNKLLDRQLKI